MSKNRSGTSFIIRVDSRRKNKMPFKRFKAIFLILVLTGLTLLACQKSIPREALMLTPEDLADRQLQTRVF